MIAERVATTPISWGWVGGNRWGTDPAPEDVLAEMASLGFRATELGVPGFLPDDVAVARELLAQHGLQPIAGPVSFLPNDPDAAMAKVDAALDRLVALGATVLMTVPKQTGEPPDWPRLLDLLARIDERCAVRGVHQAVHPHVGSQVETVQDMERILADDRIGWCLDTAHIASGGMDPVEFARAAGERIHHFHLKDADLDLGARMVRHEVDFDEAIRGRVFRALGDGDLDIPAIIDVMSHRDDVWWVLEQDRAPQPAPNVDAAASLSYLKGTRQ